MNKKIDLNKLFENKQFLRIFSVVIALLLWVIVSMTSKDTITRVIYNVPVNLDSQTADLADLRLHLVGQTEYTVNIEVKGPRTIVGQLHANSPALRTSANFSHISEPGPYSPEVVSAPASYTDPGFKIEGYSPQRLSVKLDRYATKTLEIESVVRGGISSPSFIYDRQFTSPEKVVITGPEANIEQITSADVSVDLTEPLEKTFSKTLPIVLRDAQGEPIDPAARSLILDVEEARLVISVLKETGLPLTVEFLNVPRGFPLEELETHMTLTSNDVMVAGPPEVVNKLTELSLGYIDMKKLQLDSHTFAFTLELEAISDQLKLTRGSETVEARFNDSTWDSVVFYNVEIRSSNLPAGYDVTLQSETLASVELVGDADVLASMSASDIVAELDLSQRGLVEGSSTYPITVSAPGKGLVWAVGDHGVVIQVTAQE